MMLRIMADQLVRMDWGDVSYEFKYDLDAGLVLLIASGLEYILHDQCVHDAFRENETPMAGLTLSPKLFRLGDRPTLPSLCKWTNWYSSGQRDSNTVSRVPMANSVQAATA
jgi:hypothetical protein